MTIVRERARAHGTGVHAAPALRCAPPSALPSALIAALGLLAASCSDPGGLGDACIAADDCAGDLQCLTGQCLPRCASHVDCGDGYLCERDGTCTAVSSEIGDSCLRELDCAAGQRCGLDDTDDGDGPLAARCAADHSGAPVGGTCSDDVDCRNGTCAIGRCVDLCQSSDDCPASQACVTIPRLLATSEPEFQGCMQGSGVLIDEIPTHLPFQSLRIPVPSHARSFALVAQIDDDDQRAGVSRVSAPDGAVLYLATNDYYANPLRYAPARGVSTLLVPNTPEIALETGAYGVDVGSFLTGGGVATSVPKVLVYYKLDDHATIDLNFYFLDLSDHPCAAGFPTGGLNAATAATSTAFQNEYLPALRAILGNAELELGTIGYIDLLDQPTFDGLEADDLPALLANGTAAGGLNVYVVRTISPAGLQGMVGGTPGVPGIPGTRASGIVLSADTLCYRDWDTMARLTAHEIGRYAGLFRNREPDGATDPIADSDVSAANLMYYSEFGGIELSPGQRQVLTRFPGWR